MLIVMIEGNIFALEIPDNYSRVNTLSIVLHAEMALLNGKVIKTKYTKEKHEEILSLMLASYKIKDYKLILLSDVNTTHCKCLDRKELIDYLKKLPKYLIHIDNVNTDKCYDEIHFNGVIKNISLYPNILSTIYTHEITGFQTNSLQEIEHYCENLLYNVKRYSELMGLNLLTKEELTQIFGEYSKYHLVNNDNFASYTVKQNHSYEIADKEGRITYCDNLSVLKEYLRNKIDFDLFVSSR